MLGETLQEGPKDHDPGAEHDGPPPAEALRKPRRKRDSEDGSKLVARVDEAKQAWLNGEIPLCILASVTQVWKLVSDCVSYGSRRDHKTHTRGRLEQTGEY